MLQQYSWVDAGFVFQVLNNACHAMCACVTCVVFVSCGMDRDTQHWMQRVLLPAQWVSK